MNRMITQTLVFALITLSSLLSFGARAGSQWQHGRMEIDLPPDSSSEEIRAYAHSLGLEIKPNIDKIQSSVIDQILVYGEKNLNWLKAINEKRAPGHKLSMTNPNNRIGFPITSPNKYSPEIISQKLQNVRKDIPQSMAEVIFGDRPVSSELPTSEEDYLNWARQVDRLYQGAARWQLMQPYLSTYRQRSQNDMRGYYQLLQIKNLDAILSQWDRLPSDQKSNLTIWLENICQNSRLGQSQCQFELNSFIRRNKVVNFKNKYWSNSEQIYKNYFKIQGVQDDVQFIDENQYKLTFEDPGSAELKSFLKINLEDEWQWKDWHFKLDFASRANVRMEFEPGSTPHVNGIAGDVITMDQNTPLTEWEVSWIIRHEFGHVLGFPDCYIEFYSDQEQAMVNYQLDTTNLMCSRAGNMKQILYDEMKRVYGR